jgi:hypothetical protein
MNPTENNPPIVAYCRICGKGLADDVVFRHDGTVYCADHVPVTASSTQSSTAGTPPPAGSGVGAPPPPVMGQPPGNSKPDISPGLAFFLGLIPGVGAIYNGQYAKGFVHFLIMGLLFSLADHSGAMEGLFRMMIPVFFFYMAFEAYHTAKKRLAGEAVDEFSSIFPVRGSATTFPILPVSLIVIGVLYLLNNLGIVTLRQLMPYAGPLFLIGIGCYLLYARMRANAELNSSLPGAGVYHERN